MCTLFILFNIYDFRFPCPKRTNNSLIRIQQLAAMAIKMFHLKCNESKEATSPLLQDGRASMYVCCESCMVFFIYFLTIRKQAEAE